MAPKKAALDGSAGSDAAKKQTAGMSGSMKSTRAAAGVPAENSTRALLSEKKEEEGAIASAVSAAKRDGFLDDVEGHVRDACAAWQASDGVVHLLLTRRLQTSPGGRDHVLRRQDRSMALSTWSPTGAGDTGAMQQGTSDHADRGATRVRLPRPVSRGASGRCVRREC